jgi:hypothetical protein|tara:strand:+ start:233 stop:574 length:342 start_codon:yes stop_codon:yes gene_type:complete
MQETENFAQNVRQAGQAISAAERAIAKTDAEEKMMVAQEKVRAEMQGHKTNAAQERCADESPHVVQARLDRGIAKGQLAAAKSDLMACEIEFKIWQSQMATHRFEKNRIYNTD